MISKKAKEYAFKKDIEWETREESNYMCKYRKCPHCLGTAKMNKIYGFTCLDCGLER